jgi:hypothetical protein
VIQIGLLLLGSLLGALSSVATSTVIERLKVKRASRIAASLILVELREHQKNLGLMLQVESIEGAEYKMIFHGSAWKSMQSMLLPGASAPQAAAIMYWYTFLESRDFKIELRNDDSEGKEGLGAFAKNIVSSFASARDAAEHICGKKAAALMEDVTADT